MTADVVVVRDPLFLEHEGPPGHPECPARLEAIHGLFTRRTDLAALPVLTPRAAGDEELLRVHAKEVIARVAGTAGTEGWLDPDTYYGPRSAAIAARAAGATLDAALAVWRGEYRRGFSLVRPPGHHATPSRSMGFCLYNNVGVAAAAVLAEAPNARVAVVDFDLHHGNGTQDLFYDTDRVLFVSSHRYPFYPGTGALDEVGRGKGKGTTMNLPLGERYGDELFLPLYLGLVVPAVREFAPDMILVSAGFDGHADDPMRGFRLTTGAYGRIAEALVAVAEERGGKILFCLEGGYDTGALAASVGEVLDKLVTAPRSRFTPEASPGDSREVELFRRFHAAFFPTLGG